jgi:hypothetical protein
MVPAYHEGGVMNSSGPSSFDESIFLHRFNHKKTRFGCISGFAYGRLLLEKDVDNDQDNRTETPKIVLFCITLLSRCQGKIIVTIAGQIIKGQNTSGAFIFCAFLCISIDTQGFPSYIYSNIWRNSESLRRLNNKGGGNDSGSPGPD